MIQLRFQKQLQKFAGVDANLMQHLQLMTDNLAQVITRGLSFDGNLNSKIVKVNVVSGRQFTLNAKELPVISGASIINTGGATVKDQKMITNSRGELEAVLTLDKDATITFLLIGD
jgi:hypothetical protein